MRVGPTCMWMWFALALKCAEAEGREEQLMRQGIGGGVEAKRAAAGIGRQVAPVGEDHLRESRSPAHTNDSGEVECTALVVAVV